MNLAVTAKDQDMIMSQDELAKELKGSLLVLTTSSPDKRDIYRLLFSSHDKNASSHAEPHHAGLNLYYTDSGALGIVPRKTPEQSGHYEGNLNEKAIQQLTTLQASDVQRLVRLTLGENQFDHSTIKIVGMTEDSGWNLVFEDKETERKFTDIIIREMEPKLREQDKWLLEKLHDTGFPGPNLKPLQEHLTGSFHELMTMIYDAADELKLKDLRFCNVVNVSFASPRLGKVFSKSFTSSGTLLSREEYEDRLMGTKHGEAINSNFVHIPGGQANGERKTIDQLIREGLHSKSSEELPANYARRDLTEYLQKLIGKRRSTAEERKRHVHIAYVTPDSTHNGHIHMPRINDYATVSVPDRQTLLTYPDTKPFDDAHVVVLIPDNHKPKDHRLRYDANLGMLLNFIVTAETDPVSMGIPIVLDNRSGGVDRALELISDAFAQGRLMGEPPFYVANTDPELADTLKLLKDVKQRAPVITTLHTDDDNAIKKPLPPAPPADEVFTLFIGGGHANNSKRDLEDARRFGYHCAKQGWRIVTGGGSVEGSMGATHTGFIEYHLNQLSKKPGGDEAAAALALAKYSNTPGKYDAEKIILEKPQIIDELADRGFIPRNMFYAYSMKPLLEMESPSGKCPPGITYFEAGNRTRRLARLLAPGNKIFMPGSIGTDEEYADTVKQHLEARLNVQQHGNANNNVFTDGTPDDMGTIIIYNREGNLDKMLNHYGLLGNDPVAATKRKQNNIHIVTSLTELKEVSNQTAKKWRNMIAKNAQSVESNGKPSSQVGISL